MSALNIDQLRLRIRSHALQPFEDRIIDLVRPCVRLCRTVVKQDELGPLDSRLRGDPHLPPGFNWPFRNGVPLAHIATVRLSDASRFDSTGLLPRSGLLYFWYDMVHQEWGFDPAHAGFMRVDYIADEHAPLVLTPMPVEQTISSVDRDRLRRTPRTPCRLRFEARLTLPNHEWLRTYVPSLALMSEGDEYSDLTEELIDHPAHYLLGYPIHIQGPMELDCQLVTNGMYCRNASDYESTRAKELGKGARDWQLLLQVDTDTDGPRWMWCDGGMLYYWIPEQALRRADFSKAWLLLQTG